MNLRKDHYWLTASGPACCLPFAAEGLPPPSPVRVSRGLRLRASPTPGARALVWAWSPAGRTDGPAPPLRQSEPAAPTASSEGRRRRVGTVARWRRAPGSPSGNYRYRPATRTSTESADWRSRPGRCPRASGYPTLLPPAEGARGVQCLLSPRLGGGRSARGFFSLQTLLPVYECGNPQ